MERQTIVPASKDEWLAHRSKDLTSTEVSALFGISPYLTKFELWHNKKNKFVVEIEESERMRWGNRLQDSIAFGLAEDNGWNVRKKDEYMRIPNLRVGSSFDFEIVGESLLEIKNVDALIFKEGWSVDQDGDIEAPPHIELQLQHQMLVSGLERGFIGALVGGNRVAKLEREAQTHVHAAIVDAASSFWESIDKDVPPDPDFKEDAKFISKLYQGVVEGKIIDASLDMDQVAARYSYAASKEKEAKKEKEAARAEMLYLIGDAEKVRGAGYTVSAGFTAPTIVQTYEREGFRNFRINWRK